MARTKANTQNDTKTLTILWRNRHLEKLYFCVNIGHTTTPVPGTYNYTIDMSFYLDPNFLGSVSGSPLHVPAGTDVYVKVFTTTDDWTVKMRLHSCFATPATSGDQNLTYFLIRDG